MIKKSELLQAIRNLENQVDRLRLDYNESVKNHDINRDRTEYVLRLLADKLGYEIKTKDVIKVVYGEKVVRQEVEIVEKPKVTLNMCCGGGITRNDIG